MIRFFGAASGLCGSICLVLALSGWARASPAQAPPIKMILDTDIGTDIDDAWALGLAMNSPEFELVAVTISDGDTTARARVACKLLHTSIGATCPWRWDAGHRRRKASTTSSRGRRLHRQAARCRACGPGDRRPGQTLPERADARRRRPAAERGGRAAAGAAASQALQARRADERLDPVVGLEPRPGARVERRAGDRRRAARVRRGLPDDDGAARLDVCTCS